MSRREQRQLNRECPHPTRHSSLAVVIPMAEGLSAQHRPPFAYGTDPAPGE